MKYVATTTFKCGREVTPKGSVYEGGDIDELLRKKLIEVAPEVDESVQPEKLDSEDSAAVVEPTPAPKGKKSKKG